MLLCKLGHFPLLGSGPDDAIMLDMSSDWLTASVGKGLLFDFSLTGGSLSVDTEKNVAVYGDVLGSCAADILHMYGRVPHSAQMELLYRKLNELTNDALK